MASRVLFDVTANTAGGQYAGYATTPPTAEYSLFQFESTTTADVQVYGRLHPDASWTLVDTVTLIANTPQLKSYFNANEWAFRVANIGAAQSVKGFAQHVL